MKRRYPSTHLKSKHNTGGWERTDNLEREGEKKEERKGTELVSFFSPVTEERKKREGRKEREMKGERREKKEGDMDLNKKREREKWKGERKR